MARLVPYTSSVIPPDAGGEEVELSGDPTHHEETPDHAWRADHATIVLAEDDLEFRKLLTWWLERAGYHVIACADGTTLMRKLGYLDATVPAAPVDLVVSDIRMPGHTGLDVLQSGYLLGDCPPVILISAFADEEAYERAERLGAVALMAKPFNVERLIETIDETLARPPASTEPPAPAAAKPAGTSFPVEVTFRHDRKRALQQPLKDFVVELASRLTRFGVPIRHCRVVIDSLHTNGRTAHEVKIVLTVPDKPVVVECDSRKGDYEEDIYVTVRVAFGKACRSLEQVHGKRKPRKRGRSEIP